MFDINGLKMVYKPIYCPLCHHFVVSYLPLILSANIGSTHVCFVLCVNSSSVRPVINVCVTPSFVTAQQIYLWVLIK